MRITSASATSTWPASSRWVARRSRSVGSGEGVSRRRTVISPPSSALSAVPPAGVGRGADQPRPGFLQAELQLLQRHRLARGEDDHADRARLARAETLAQQRLEEAQGDAAIERAPRGEGDQQPLGAVGIADRGARLGVELADALLERGDAAADLGIDQDPLAARRRRPAAAAACGGGGDRGGGRRLNDRRGAGVGAMPSARAPASQWPSR